MVIVMVPGATETQVAALMDRVRSFQLDAHVSEGTRTVVTVSGDDGRGHLQLFEGLEGVDRVVATTPPFRLAGRLDSPEDRVIELPNGVPIGGGSLTLIAGPCAVESRAQLDETAEALSAVGVRVLRGGAYKPRTSPYSFQGLGEEGLVLLREVGDRRSMAVVTEVLTPEDVAVVSEYADMLQIGARNMFNVSLLRAVGEGNRPVLLKRGPGASLDELLHAAEHILAGGNERVAVCERGIRTFERATRYTLDINAVPVLKAMTPLPVIVDPSHAAGRSRWVPSLALAAVAAGADALMVEVHPRPAEALSDGAQSLDPGTFSAMVADVRRVTDSLGRRVS